MPDRREPDDARLQRLADLSIEIRMLKARVQAAVDEDRPILPFSNSVSGASCPHCGHTAGLALLPREYRQPTTLVRCFACQRDASTSDWMVVPVRPRVASSRPHR